MLFQSNPTDAPGTLNKGSDMKSMIFRLMAVGLLAGPLQANAVAIVDTGVPTDLASFLTIAGAQGRAAQFSAGSAFEIDSIELYLAVVTSGNLTVTLREDSAGLPGSVLFSTVVSVGPASAGNWGWQGASGLNWMLGAGTYWATMEARISGVSINLPTAAPNPVIKEAGLSVGVWGERFLDTGWRIEGPSDSVPEPGTLALLGLGLAGLGLSRRRKA